MELVDGVAHSLNREMALAVLLENDSGDLRGPQVVVQMRFDLSHLKRSEASHGQRRRVDKDTEQPKRLEPKCYFAQPPSEIKT